MAILIKNSIGMKAKIQMRMLGAVVVLYLMLVISVIFTSQTRKITLDKVDNSIALLQVKITRDPVGIAIPSRVKFGTKKIRITPQ